MANRRSHEMRYKGKAYRIFTIWRERENKSAETYTVRVSWNIGDGMDVAEYLQKFQNRLTLLAGAQQERFYRGQTPAQVRVRLLAWRKRADKAGFTASEKWGDE